MPLFFEQFDLESNFSCDPYAVVLPCNCDQTSKATSQSNQYSNTLQKYIEHAVSLEGLSLEVPLYKLSEGYEPCFFKVFFSWDNSKSVVRHNVLALHFTIFTKYVPCINLFSYMCYYYRFKGILSKRNLCIFLGHLCVQRYVLSYSALGSFFLLK